MQGLSGLSEGLHYLISIIAGMVARRSFLKYAQLRGNEEIGLNIHLALILPLFSPKLIFSAGVKNFLITAMSLRFVTYRQDKFTKLN